uniref:Glycosyltransferase 61 catalytic domain-containing protein n=1 Tax=Peronospora matthiolae TaxID=2874970 RepID=A0AAV1TIV3_9STRA
MLRALRAPIPIVAYGSSPFLATATHYITAPSRLSSRGLNLKCSPEQLNRLVVQRTRPPHVYESHKTKDECYAEQDVGIIADVRKSAKTFCASGGWDHPAQAPASPTQATKVSRFHTRGGIDSTVLQNVMLDFVNVSIHAPIKSIADDGFHHDPRFNFNMELISCACDEYANYFQKLPGEKERIAEMMWRDLLKSVPDKKDIPEPVFCSVERLPGRSRSRWDFVEHPTKAPDGHETVVFEDPVVLVARHDDHNPFFQLSSAYNAWIILKALEWDTMKTRVIHLDGGYPSLYDALHREMLGPNFEIIEGATLIGKRVHFRGDVLLAPFEFSGPVIQHVDHNESCYDSELLKTFRAQSLLAFNITPEVERELGVTRIRPMYVTVITRQPYAGRKLQRMWLNENEVMRNMRKDYNNLSVQFRSIDYVKLTLHEQMTTTIESDMIVSMHGAGLVNVLWTRPMTTIVEIFPKEKYRYGYQNICHHVGCAWHEFRGGEDVGGGSTPNTKNKRIPYAEWKEFFHPLFQQTYDAFEEQQAVLRGEAS